MTEAAFADFLRDLEGRRKELGMTLDVLARRSGLSRATVCRLLSGGHVHADFLHIVSLAKALGIGVEFKPTPVDDFVEEQAERQSRRLVGMVQGTMGLESQAVGAEEVARMERDARRRLLAGSRRKLWVE
jgi:transcriptional regulator with XRE-family HTH domain